jgi:hypothetical protein
MKGKVNRADLSRRNLDEGRKLDRAKAGKDYGAIPLSCQQLAAGSFILKYF